jgi:ABC-type branched-subunit amino acid transport system substrate-binding protein
MNLRIGLFLPKSDMFPKLSFEFLNGIKLPFNSLNESQEFPQFIFEGVGNGADKDMLSKIEKMLLQDDVDAIVCFCSYFFLDQLTTMANTYKKPIFHVTLGARVVKEIHFSPYLIHQSLNLSHSCYLSALMGVEKFGKKVAMLSSFYDGGYHMAEAFYNGLVEKDGEIVYNYVSPMDYQAESFENMISGLQTTRPDFAFMIFSYNEAKKIMEVMLKNGLADLPAFVVPLMTDESLLTHAMYPNNIFSIASWSFDTNDTNMNGFVANYHSDYEENPNIMGLLGFEVGSMIVQAFQNEGHLPKQIGDYFKTVNIKSPRGQINLTSFNEIIASDFKLRKLEPFTDHYQNVVVDVINKYSAATLYEKMAEVPDTGWKNPYICT